MDTWLLISPLARGAYFDAMVDVSVAEFQLCFPEHAVEPAVLGGMPALRIRGPALDLKRLGRLSFLQGAFQGSANQLAPIDLPPAFDLPDSLVFGAKYAGKTNELVTQLAINTALAFADLRTDGPIKVLDPTAGRGTTLLWAARYGMVARGIERDKKALADFQRHVKRQTKLQRIKHKELSGFTTKKNANDLGRFLEYRFAAGSARLVIGDSKDAPRLLGGERFHLVVGDLPYGIQHRGSGRTRNPLENLRSCATAWAASLHPGGAMVLVFNAFMPRRDGLVRVFEDAGLEALPFAAPHRMSESILRELAVFRKPR